MTEIKPSRRDDIESLYYVLTYIVGGVSLFEKKGDDLYKNKVTFCNNATYMVGLFFQSVQYLCFYRFKKKVENHFVCIEPRIEIV